jgi:hypothetical protein
MLTLLHQQLQVVVYDSVAWIAHWHPCENVAYPENVGKQMLLGLQMRSSDCFVNYAQAALRH